jgi:O-6-methylguanine DNA methyltransferase
MTMSIEWFESPLGPLIAAATSDALCALEFAEQETFAARLDALRQRYAALPASPGPNAHLSRLRQEMGEYFQGRRREFSMPLSYAGTPFQQKVWSLLLEIPYGQTWSYKDLAVRAGDVKATRAVGSANGMNPLAIVVPCHRVVNTGGQLGGYGGGLWRKRLLLDLERGQGSLDL